MNKNITLDNEGVYSEISMQDFFGAIGGPLEVILKQNETSHEVFFFTGVY